MIATQQTTEETAMIEANAKVNQFLASYLESQVSLWDSYVDPREAYLGNDGELWNGIGVGVNSTEEQPFKTCEELFQMQAVGRILARDNEFAINGHRNRTNYIIGKSHTYTAVGETRHVEDAIVEKVQAVLDQILKANKWKRRQKEIKLRDDRDGETFIRTFASNDGIMKFRFIEPRSIKPKTNAQPHEAFGVVTEKNDRESVIAYHVDGEDTDASEIQHRKFNVDSSIARGFPMFYPVRKNLSRASKLLRNMSLATEIQTAIALIRKHKQATQQAVRSFVSARADQMLQGPDGKAQNVLQYGPGSIIDTAAGTEYDVPKQLDPSKTISALQAELRAIASRLVMPEFMLTSDASNGNFSSLMIGEGPAVKNFESDQDEQIDYDLELIEKAMEHAVNSGLITREEWNACCIQVEAPNVQVRDRLQESQIRQNDMGIGLLSPQTASAQANLDYHQEQANIESHAERNGMPLTPDRPDF